VTKLQAQATLRLYLLCGFHADLHQTYTERTILRKSKNLAKYRFEKNFDHQNNYVGLLLLQNILTL